MVKLLLLSSSTGGETSNYGDWESGRWPRRTCRRSCVWLRTAGTQPKSRRTGFRQEVLWQGGSVRAKTNATKPDVPEESQTPGLPVRGCCFYLGNLLCKSWN
ncbi:hypothetical protein FOZ61_009871 [Perkinsus olseni]|uniref:Uncharacterized protein n=1 Tax=Perkinsus olseni TaxID=32597 RepID=A0A7J6L022_PEROL|nr:hypothetical protein FOZ61_009871 [Perkinsus olseni]